MADALLIANVVSTLWMCGLIALVQAVHYPMFDRYERSGCATTMREHQRRITPIVAVPMLVELVSGVALIVLRPTGVPVVWPVVGVVLIAGWMISTVGWQIPAHRVLAGGFDEAAHKRLVSSNRWRTACWMARGAVVATMLALRLRTA